MPTLNIWTKRFFELENYAVRNRLKGCVRRRDFYDLVGYAFGNKTHLKTGSQDIRPQHIHTAAQVFGLDVNWFFNPAHKKMFLQHGGRDPLDLIREGVALIEQERGVKKNVNSAGKKAVNHKK